MFELSPPRVRAAGSEALLAGAYVYTMMGWTGCAVVSHSRLGIMTATTAIAGSTAILCRIWAACVRTTMNRLLGRRASGEKKLSLANNINLELPGQDPLITARASSAPAATAKALVPAVPSDAPSWGAVHRAG